MCGSRVNDVHSQTLGTAPNYPQFCSHPVEQKSKVNRWITLAQHSSKTEPQLEGLELNREILRLALPALGALLAQPLFTTIDSAMVGHLGTEQLAGLALSSTILMTAVGLFISWLTPQHRSPREH